MASLQDHPFNHQMKTAMVERSHALTLPSGQKSPGGNSAREAHGVGRNKTHTHHVTGLAQVLQQTIAVGAASFS